MPKIIRIFYKNFYSKIDAKAVRRSFYAKTDFLQQHSALLNFFALRELAPSLKLAASAIV